MMREPEFGGREKVHIKDKQVYESERHSKKEERKRTKLMAIKRFFPHSLTDYSFAFKARRVRISESM